MNSVAIESKTVGELHAEGNLPPDFIVPVSLGHIDDAIKNAVQFGWDGAETYYLRGEGRSFLGDLLLPNGTRFGDAFPCDLLPYAHMTIDEIVASLADPDEDEADFIEDGSTPVPDEAEFISEEEDENPSGVIR